MHNFPSVNLVNNIYYNLLYLETAGYHQKVLLTLDTLIEQSYTCYQNLDKYRKKYDKI